MKLVRFAFAGAMFAGALAASTFASAAELLTVQLKDGPVVIELMPDVAPKHVAQIEALAKKGAYDNVAFHRVIDGFMAQTGDVQYGNMEKGFSAQRAGTGGSDLPDIPAEFSKVPFTRGVVGMARSQDPNSANSQFFICFTDSPWLNKQYTVWGQVIEGMEAIDKVKRGEPVKDPDSIVSMKLASAA